MTRAILIDASHWQGTLKYLGNVDGICLKATEGTGWVDPKYKVFVSEAVKAKFFGVYHYFRTQYDPVAQAEHFFNTTKDADPDFYMIDYEGANNVLNAVAEANLWKFYQKLKTLTNKQIILYTNEYTLRDNLLVYNNRWLTIPTWIARYTNSLNPQTDSPLFLDIPELMWNFWQYSADGNGKGAEYGVGSNDVDLNVFNGTVADLEDFLGTEPEPPAPPAQCNYEEEIALLRNDIRNLESKFSRDLDVQNLINEDAKAARNSIWKELLKLAKAVHYHPQWLDRFFRK